MGRVSLALGATALFVSPAQAATAPAGAVSTWVSATGTDSGTCALATPCRTFQYAYGQTMAGGEIDVKDAGRFGQLTITKAISVVAVGVQAGMSVPAGATGITVNAGPNDTVVIRGLTLDGHGVGYNGIFGLQAGKLFVQDCVVQGMTNSGFEYNANETPVSIVLSNLVAQNNAVGIEFPNYPQLHTKVSIVNSKILQNATGLYARSVVAVMKSTHVEFNSTNGLDLTGSIIISDSLFFGNAAYNFDGYVGSAGNNDVLDTGLTFYSSPQK
jgi:hypothetical protein